MSSAGHTSIVNKRRRKEAQFRRFSLFVSPLLSVGYAITSRQRAAAWQQATDPQTACPFARSPLAPSDCALISENSTDLLGLEASVSPLLTVSVPVGRRAAESLHGSPRPVMNDDALYAGKLQGPVGCDEVIQTHQLDPFWLESGIFQYFCCWVHRFAAMSTSGGFRQGLAFAW